MIYILLISVTWGPVMQKAFSCHVVVMRRIVWFEIALFVTTTARHRHQYVNNLYSTFNRGTFIVRHDLMCSKCLLYRLTEFHRIHMFYRVCTIRADPGVWSFTKWGSISTQTLDTTNRELSWCQVCHPQVAPQVVVIMICGAASDDRVSLIFSIKR